MSRRTTLFVLLVLAFLSAGLGWFLVKVVRQPRPMAPRAEVHGLAQSISPPQRDISPNRDRNNCDVAQHVVDTLKHNALEQAEEVLPLLHATNCVSVGPMPPDPNIRTRVLLAAQRIATHIRETQTSDTALGQAVQLWLLGRDLQAGESVVDQPVALEIAKLGLEVTLDLLEHQQVDEETALRIYVESSFQNRQSPTVCPIAQNHARRQILRRHLSASEATPSDPLIAHVETALTELCEAWEHPIPKRKAAVQAWVNRLDNPTHPTARDYLWNPAQWMELEGEVEALSHLLQGATLAIVHRYEQDTCPSELRTPHSVPFARPPVDPYLNVPLALNAETCRLSLHPDVPIRRSAFQVPVVHRDPSKPTPSRRWLRDFKLPSHWTP